MKGKFPRPVVRMRNFFKGQQERKPLGRPLSHLERGFYNNSHLAFGRKKMANLRIFGFQIQNFSVGGDYTEGDQLLAYGPVVKRTESHAYCGHPSPEWSAL